MRATHLFLIAASSTSLGDTCPMDGVDVMAAGP